MVYQFCFDFFFLLQKSSDQIKQEEQDRLDEILLICSEYEKQNQTTYLIGGGSAGSPVPVQNRIKTNGSLPREKSTSKSPTNGASASASAFEFPEVVAATVVVKKRVSEYENVIDRKAGLSLNFVDGYENEAAGAKKVAVPQSPRTRIRTVIASPKPPPEMPASKAAEYDAIIKSFEEKLKVEIQLLQEKKQESSTPTAGQGHNVTLDDKQKERSEVIKTIRHLKTMINDLQNQEEEVQREMDVEKALVNAELASEDSIYNQYQEDLNRLQNNLQRAEAQRNSNRVMQETNQYKLKQGIDVKQEHARRLETLLESEPKDDKLIKEKEKITEELENDKKVFEDLEFQYLEEETEW